MRPYKNMRLYTFINFYLSQIQQGIQTAHIVHELFNKFKEDSYKQKFLRDWSENHKTIIVLNAGADQQIQELLDVFATSPFPFTSFEEDEGLCGARTGCGIVLPDWVYDASRVVQPDSNGEEIYEFTQTTSDGKILTMAIDHAYYPLISLIKSKRLA